MRIQPGSTSRSVRINIQDSSSTTGALLAGLVYNSSGLTAGYRLEGQSSFTAITLVTATAGTWTSGGFIQVLSGRYELGLPNAAVAGGLARWCDIELYGATNMVPVSLRLDLDWHVPEIVRGTLASVASTSVVTLDTNAPATTSFLIGDEILITGGTGAGQRRWIQSYTSARVATVNPVFVTLPDTTSTYIIIPTTGNNMVAWNGSVVSVVNSLPNVLVTQIRLYSQAGGTVSASPAPTSTTFTFTPSGISTVNNYYQDQWVVVTSGTGIGQSRRISAFNGSTSLFTVTPAFLVTLDGTSAINILPAGMVDVGAFGGTTAVLDGNGYLGVNVVDVAGTASQGTAGYMGLDFAHTSGTTATVSLPNITIGTVSTLTGNTPQTGDSYPIVSSATYGNSAIKTALGTLATSSSLSALQTTANTISVNVSAIPTNPLTTLGATAPANWITSSTFAAGATIPRVTLADTLTTYTNNTPQSGDCYPVVTNGTYGLQFLARRTDLPNNLSTLSISAGNISGSIGSVTGNVSGKVLGGGASTITGVGAWVYNETGLSLGTAAGQTSILNSISGITVNTARSSPRVPEWFLRPASGTNVVKLDIYLYTLQGALEDADGNTITIHAQNSGGTSYDSKLASTTMTRLSAGKYEVSYTVSSTDSAEEVLFDFTWTVGSIPMADGAATTIADADSISTLNTILTDITAIQSTLGTAGSGLTGLPNAILAVSQPNYAPAKAGDAMTLTGGTHTTISTDVQTGMTNQGYSTARSGYLDTLNGLVATQSDATWSYGGGRTLTSFGFTVSANDYLGNPVAPASQVAGLITTVGAAGVGLTNLGDTRIANLDTTISSRLAATWASGVTSVANWLRTLIRNSTPDSTALSEINTGGGTYAPTTESVQAIALTIAPGTGAFLITITVQDGNGAPLQNAKVAFSFNGISLIQITNSSGIVTFNLDAATYTVGITCTGYVFAGSTMVVTGNASCTYSMTSSIPIISPGALLQAPGYLICYDDTGAVEQGVVVTLELVNIPSTFAGQGLSNAYRTMTSDSSGLVVFTGLWQGARYKAKRTNGNFVEFIVPNADTLFTLPTVIGRP